MVNRRDALDKPKVILNQFQTELFSNIIHWIILLKEVVVALKIIAGSSLFFWIYFIRQTVSDDTTTPTAFQPVALARSVPSRLARFHRPCPKFAWFCLQWTRTKVRNAIVCWWSVDDDNPPALVLWCSVQFFRCYENGAGIIYDTFGWTRRLLPASSL